MRGLVAGVAMLCCIQSAAAADLDGYLRGSVAPTYHWGGAYGGVQVGYANGSVNFGDAVDRLIFLLAGDTLRGNNLPFLGQTSTSGTTFGAFVGYNAEWESVILGVELNYNGLSSITFPQNSCCFTTNQNAIPVDANASLHLTDLATFRARAGWEIGQFLPYAFGGLAVSRQDVRLSASIPGTTANVTSTQNGEFAYGFTAGAGIDIAIWSALFFRGEWEFTRVTLITSPGTFVASAPTNGLTLNMNTVRGGVGIRF